jgi:hypothetical protein
MTHRPDKYERLPPDRSLQSEFQVAPFNPKKWTHVNQQVSGKRTRDGGARDIRGFNHMGGSEEQQGHRHSNPVYRMPQVVRSMSDLMGFDSLTSPFEDQERWWTSILSDTTPGWCSVLDPSLGLVDSEEKLLDDYRSKVWFKWCSHRQPWMTETGAWSGDCPGTIRTQLRVACLASTLSRQLHDEAHRRGELTLRLQVGVGASETIKELVLNARSNVGSDLTIANVLESVEAGLGLARDILGQDGPDVLGILDNVDGEIRSSLSVVMRKYADK